MQIQAVSSVPTLVRSPFSVPTSESKPAVVHDSVTIGPPPAAVDAPPPHMGFREVGRKAVLAVALTLALGTGVTACAAATAPPPPGPSITQQASQDIGSRADVAAVKKAIAQQNWQPGNVSVSHDWALGRGFTKEDAVSVLLHKTDGRWKVADSDGGAYVGSILQEKGVPAADIPTLLQTYAH